MLLYENNPVLIHTAVCVRVWEVLSAMIEHKIFQHGLSPI